MTHLEHTTQTLKSVSHFFITESNSFLLMFLEAQVRVGMHIGSEHRLNFKAWAPWECYHKLAKEDLVGSMA